MKRTLTVLLASAMVFSMAACGSKPAGNSSSSAADKAPAAADKAPSAAESAAAESGEKVSVKFGNTNGEQDIQTMSLFEVERRLEEATNGNFSVDVFPSSSLGATDDLTEQAMQGAAILTISDPGRLASFVKDYGIIQMPYMLEDYKLLDKLMETDIYKQWEKDFEDQGIKLVTSNWYSGARHFVCNKEINTPEDLKGLRIRTIGSDLFTKSVTAMGAVATPMEWSEVYPSIQQKALDGAEVQTPSSYASRLYEICSYTNKTGHFQLIGSAVTGTKFFNSLSPEYQQLFTKTFRDVGTEYQAQCVQLSEDYEKDMAEKHGMTIHEVDPAPFIAAVQPVYEELGYSQLRDQILAELKK